MDDFEEFPEVMEPLRINDAMGAPTAAEGQPSASSSTDPVTRIKALSARFSDEFYDIVLYDFLHENILGDSKHLNKITKLCFLKTYQQFMLLSMGYLSQATRIHGNIHCENTCKGAPPAISGLPHTLSLSNMDRYIFRLTHKLVCSKGPSLSR